MKVDGRHVQLRHIRRCTPITTVQLAPGDLGEVAKCNPAAAERIRGQLVSHLRSAWPESVYTLGELPSPGEITRDARGQQS